MLFSDERLVQNGKPSSDEKVDPMNVDNEILSAVAGQFSRMEQEHARIREEALAASSSQTVQSEALNDRDRAEPIESLS